MERGWTEGIGKMNDEELIRIIQRKGVFAIEAAKEMLSRLEKGDSNINNYLCPILEFKSSPKTHEEVKEIKEKVVMIAIKQGLSERVFLSILYQDEIGLDKKELAGEKFLESDKVTNYGLRKIIEMLPSLRERAIEKLRKQENLGGDDYLIAVEYGEGKIQIEALNKYWPKMKGEDIAYLISQDIIPKIIWRRIKAEKRMDDLENEDLIDIAKYTNYQNIKRESLRELWPKRKESLDDDQLKLVFDNAHLISKNPEKIRSEIAKVLSLKERSAKEILEIREKVNSPKVKLELAEIALKKLNKEIKELEAGWPSELRKERIEELKKIKLSLEIESQKKVIYIPS
jgi:hypothetical protein